VSRTRLCYSPGRTRAVSAWGVGLGLNLSKLTWLRENQGFGGGPNLDLPHQKSKKSRGSSLNPFRLLKPSTDSRYIAFVIIILNYHAQLNKSIYYILVYISTCAFPILLDYSLWLYYLALHYLLTRGYDYLIGKYRNTLNVLITEYRLPNAQLYLQRKAKNGQRV
jgi:hypothetical protein